MIAHGVVHLSKKERYVHRIVVDYRKLNSVTVYDPFYMPSTEEVIARLGQAQFLSKLDLAKGFHQVPMADNSKDFTIFSCKFRKYRYLRMPFGLRNAPSTFQVMLQRCLLNLEAFSSPYMDDVIIFSQTWSNHLSHLFQVLSRLKLHGLTVKQS